MKKRLFVVFIALVIAAIFLGCQKKYTDGVAVPKDYPDELEIYDDAVIFDVIEDENAITIFFGTDDDEDEVIEFYILLMDSLQLICNEQEAKRHEYKSEGIGSTYEFEIEVYTAEDKKHKKYFDTVVKIEVEFDEDRVELMEDMQGYWLYNGTDGELYDHLIRTGMMFEFDDNKEFFYENFQSALAESYAFYLEDSKSISKSEAKTTEPYDISFETIDDTEVMTMKSAENPPQHYVRVTEDEIDEYKKINETWNKVKGFWQRVGVNGTITDEVKGHAFDFYDFHFDGYVNSELKVKEMVYEFLDSNTITYGLGDEDEVLGIVFEAIDGIEVMTHVYEQGEAHYQKTTLEDYLKDIGKLMGKQTLEDIQGLWYMVGVDGEITDLQKKLGFAYEFTGSSFDTYNDFIMTNFDTEFMFINEDTFEYTTSTGNVITVTISFENIEGLDVMTYKYEDRNYHFIKVSYEEFMGNDKPVGADTLDSMQGFWHMVGVNGDMNKLHENKGFAYEFNGNSFASYSNFALGSQNVEFAFIDENTISYSGSDGTGYTAQISFETIENQDVLTYIYNATNYHFVKTTYDSFLDAGELSNMVLEFWIMVGQEGALSDEVRKEGSAIEFTEDLMTTYVNFTKSYEISDFEFISEDTIKYDLGTGKLTAKIEFKKIDGMDVLCATILLKEYYFISSTYDDFIAYK